MEVMLVTIVSKLACFSHLGDFFHLLIWGLGHPFTEYHGHPSITSSDELLMVQKSGKDQLIDSRTNLTQYLREFDTPWKINCWNLQPSPMKRKENDLNQTSMIRFHVNLPGCTFQVVQDDSFHQKYG